METSWCIVRVRSGTEAKVVSAINEHCSSDVLDIFSPSLELRSIKTSSGRDGRFTSFSGYIFVKLGVEYGQFVDKLVKIRALCKILTVENKPRFISEEELNKTRLAIQSFQSNGEESGISSGSNVKIIKGSFEGYTGIVDSIDSSSLKAKVRILFCGQNVDVMFDISQLQLDS